jgi:hypothetical protein
MRTIDTDSHGELAVIDVWKECRNTKTGWSGVNEKGERVNIAYRPSESDFGPARMPLDRDYVVLIRGDVGGAPEGVVLIERASRAKSKKESPRGWTAFAGAKAMKGAMRSLFRMELPQWTSRSRYLRSVFPTIS